MIGIIAFNVVTLGAIAAVASGVVPAHWIRAMLDWLHNTIGITSPEDEKMRMVSAVWLVSTMVIVDGTLFMLVFLTSRLM